MADLTSKISITWGILDVLGQDPTLTPTEASEILERLKRYHDATVGINWDVIDQTIWDFKKEKGSK